MRGLPPLADPIPRTGPAIRPDEIRHGGNPPKQREIEVVHVRTCLRHARSNESEGYRQQAQRPQHQEKVDDHTLARFDFEVLHQKAAAEIQFLAKNGDQDRRERLDGKSGSTAEPGIRIERENRAKQDHEGAHHLPYETFEDFG